MTPKIDPEFKSLLASLSKEEREQLEANILSDGAILEPITVWDGILLDGHNRLEIAKKHDLPYAIKEIELKDRHAALTWIINHQLGKRNLTPQQASYLRGKRKLAEVKNVGRPNKKCSGNQNIKPTERTNMRLGREFGVNHTVIAADGKYAKAVDAIAESAGPEAREKILSGEIKVPRSRLVETIGECTKSEVKNIFALPPEQRLQRLNKSRGAKKVEGKSSLSKLKRYWKYMTPHERENFLIWAKKQDPEAFEQYLKVIGVII